MAKKEFNGVDRVRKLSIDLGELKFENPINAVSNHFSFMIHKKALNSLEENLGIIIPDKSDRIKLEKMDEREMHKFWKKEFGNDLIYSNMRGFESCPANLDRILKNHFSPLIYDAGKKKKIYFSFFFNFPPTKKIEFWKGGINKVNKRNFSNACSITSLSKRCDGICLDASIKTKDFKSFLIHFENAFLKFKEMDLPLMVVNSDSELQDRIVDLLSPFFFYQKKPIIFETPLLPKKHRSSMPEIKCI